MAIQAAPSGPRRIEFHRVGPADNAHIQEGAARRGSAFPKGYKFPGGGVFKVRRPEEARAWDIEPSRAYIRHAVMEANDSDWEEPELPWNSVPMGRYEGKLRTFTTPRKKFPGAQFIVNQRMEGRSLAKYTTKELSVMPEEEREKSSRFTIQASPSWSDTQLVREVLSENMGEVKTYIPYFRADCNSPSLVGRGNFEENGERIREDLGQVVEGQ